MYWMWEIYQSKTATLLLRVQMNLVRPRLNKKQRCYRLMLLIRNYTIKKFSMGFKFITVHIKLCSEYKLTITIY